MVEIVQANLPALCTLCERCHVRSLSLFGSATTSELWRSMPPRDRRALLADVVEACDRLIEVATDSSADDYVNDWKLRAIAERQFITIGEALAALRRLDPYNAGRATVEEKIIDFRNIVVHGYDVVDDRVVWSIIETDVPRLRREADALIQELL